MLYVAKSILKDNASAEDAVSESMIKIIKNLGKISDISCHKTKGYIVIIVRNTALSLLSKYKNRKEDSDELLHEIADTDISALDELTNEESLNFINKAVLSLPKPLSDVLYLSIVNGYDNKEISRLLNINYDLVRKRLSRAKKAVRKILSETGEVYGGQKRKNL
jgi:RNA polymerase sigma-70 factor (ECF subfamily)